MEVYTLVEKQIDQSQVLEISLHLPGSTKPGYFTQLPYHIRKYSSTVVMELIEKLGSSHENYFYLHRGGGEMRNFV